MSSFEKFVCSNCRLEFEGSDSTVICPRCSSKRIEKQGKGKQTEQGFKEEKNKGFRSPYVYRDGKEGWRDFHSQDTKTCPDCGGTDFDFNWKHKEKVCKKCGNVLPLPRKFA